MTETKNIYTKLAAVQNEIGVLAKDANNPFFESRYLTLDKIVANLLPLLAKHQLCVYQCVQRDVLQTVVVDLESDKQITSECTIDARKVNKNKQSEIISIEDYDAQKQGSAITYARRYSLGCLFLIQTEEDDDGNRASSPSSTAAKPSNFKAVNASDKQVNKILFEAERTGTPLTQICTHYKVKDLKNLTSKQAYALIKHLVDKPAKK